MNWQEYQDEYVQDDGYHRSFPQWQVSGCWEFQRSDGLITAHKMESPFMSWQRTVEESMKWADENIELGAELPDGMRSRHDPLYLNL